MAPKKNDGNKKSPPQVKIQLTSNPKEKTGLIVTLFYMATSLVLLCYCGYLYDRNGFQSVVTDKVPPLKQLLFFFDLIEAFSPFHEFIDDDILIEKMRQQKAKSSKSTSKKIVFTPEELKAYDGSNPDKGPYLAFLGHVFDVSKGKEYYGPGGGYSFFSGRDASRAFITGEFNEEGLVDDVIGLETENYLGLSEWLSFYNTDYKHVGYLKGRYFDGNGEPTEYTAHVRHLTEAAESLKNAQQEEHEIFPPCNTAWSQTSGHKIWCTNKSGGVERNWVGVPRRLFAPGKGQDRCACVKDSGPPSDSAASGKTSGRGDLDHPHLKEYAGCEPTSASCQISPPEMRPEKEVEEEEEEELNAEDLRLMHGVEL